ncbi:tRNA dihydrouridine synthase [Marinospirillum insulare]|uniref:tRNA-dihydrouridine(16) synthase n=1 Tax=Marinospirillum insulare TaxID=217169 RepID=A0ABQ5ZW36_9GAMM|nr:tRNA-dihydrouridine synthase family protein [Marinospirillum insulare]GLR63647.1 tRNA-dihydrouridine(16) synthase [Marinospirillum insulare]
MQEKLPALVAVAPMEGVMDATTRDLITRQGGWDFCVTEFLRVTTGRQPARVFHRICPELRQNAQTPTGIPVHLQLLGSDPQSLADNACMGVKAGAQVIDLNYGCPAKIVNRHLGGASMLRYPDRLYDATHAVAQALKTLDTPVTAKMRLGYDDTELTLDNARALNAAGISQLVVHARTRAQGYKPPAHWEWVARIEEVVDVPVFANGDIWTVNDYQRCVQVSGVQDVMLGRSSMTNPWLAKQIKQHLAGKEVEQVDFKRMLGFLLEWLKLDALVYEEIVRVMRVKQWLVMFRLRWGEEAQIVFDACKRLTNERDLINNLESYIQHTVS